MGNKYIRLSYWKQLRSRNDAEKNGKAKEEEMDCLHSQDYVVRTTETQSPVPVSKV